MEGITTMHSDQAHGDHSIYYTAVPQLQVPLPSGSARILVGVTLVSQYHEVKLKIKFSLGYYLNTDDDVNVWAEYVYLGPRASSVCSRNDEYLIEQLQRFDAVSSSPDQWIVLQCNT